MCSTRSLRKLSLQMLEEGRLCLPGSLRCPSLCGLSFFLGRYESTWLGPALLLVLSVVRLAFFGSRLVFSSSVILYVCPTLPICNCFR
jgi:hypothetical protein